MRNFTQKWVFLLMTLFCCLGIPQVVMAQEDCISIGTGTTAIAYYTPIANYYHNSYSQQLYLASEINHTAGNITSIAFAYTATSSTKRTISIYMANTDATSLSSSYVTDGFEEVLSATVIEFDNSSDWFTIELETPFLYDGTNLVVAVYMNYSSEETNYSGGYRFLQTSVTGMARYNTNDTESPNQLIITNGVPSVAGSANANRPNIQFCFAAGPVAICSKPTNVAPSAISAHGATIEIVGGSGTYNVEYKKASAEDWISYVAGTTSTSVAITGLDAATAYQVRVQSVCEDEAVSGWKQISIETECETISDFSTAWSENFDGITGSTNSIVLPLCWDYINENTYSSNKTSPTAYNSATYSKSGSNSLRFYSYYSSTTNPQDVYAILPPMENINMLRMRLSARAYSTYDATFTVGVLSDPDDASTFEAVKVITPTETTYEDYVISMASYEGDGEYIAIKMAAADASHTYRYVYIDDIVVEALPSCLEPENLEQDLTELAAHTAKLRWSDSQADGWEYWYHVADEELHSPTDADFAENDWIDASEAPANITVPSLLESTTYVFYLRSTCGDEESAYDSVFFRTIQEPIAIPAEGFSDDFETDKGWRRLNGGLTNGWFRGTATNNGGSRAMYIGSDNTYDNTSAAMVYAAKSFIFEAGTYYFSFDWKAEGESTNDYLRVALVPADIELEAGTAVPTGFSATALPKRWIAIDGGKLNLQDEWQNYGLEKEVEEAGAYMVVFAWRNNASAGGNPPAAIDNFFLKKVTCFVPSGLNATFTPGDGTVASLSWQKEGTENQWKVQYGTTADFTGATEETANEMSLNLNNLTPSTKYYVRVKAVCGEEDESGWSEPIVFTTQCDALTVGETGYTENFNAYTGSTSATAPTGYPDDQLPDCWQFLCRSKSTSTYPQAFISSNTGYNVSGNSLFFRSSKDSSIFAVMPKFTENIADLQLSFQYRNEGTGASNGKLIVGYLTNPTDTTTFEEILTCAQVTTMTAKEVTFKGAPAGSYIAFKYQGGTSNNYYLSIDDVVVTLKPSCIVPINLKVVGDSLTAHSVALTWTPQGDETNWAIKYKKAADEAWTLYAGVVDKDTFSLKGLDAATKYNVMVAAACSPEDTTNYTLPISFYTPCELRSVAAGAYVENFDSYTGSTSATAPTGYPDDQWPDCWEFINRSTSTSTYPQAFITSNSGYYATGKCLFFKTSSSTPLFAVLPEFVENIADLQLNFKYRNESVSASNGTLIVGYMTNPADTATFEEVESYAQVTTLTAQEVLFTGAPAGSRIAFKIKGGTANNYYLSIDDVKVAKIPTCFTPKDLKVLPDSAETHSVMLTWTPKGTETAWAIQYKKQADETWLDYGAAVTTDTFRLPGLESATVYDIKVAAWCDSDDMSEFTSSVSATTLCEPVASFPWSENFDGMTGKTSGKNMPLCWDILNTGSNTSYNYYPMVYSGATYANSGVNSLKFYMYKSTTAAAGAYSDQYAILPEMEGISALRMKFNARKNSASYDATFSVGVMTDPTNDSTYVALATIQPSGTTYEPFVVMFDSYEGEGKYIAIKMELPASSYKGAYIDDIAIDSIPSCLEPESIALVGTTATTAVFTYEAAEGDSLSYAYALAGVDPAEDAYTGITEDTITIEGLLDNTAYVIYLRKECATSYSPYITVSCHTKQMPVSPVDFSEDFEDAEAINRWMLINGELMNAWVIDTAAHNGENSAKALYISNDGGKHHAYTITDNTMVYATKLFNFEEGMYTFQYDWVAYGESTSDYLRVALVPDSIELAASTAVLSGMSATTLPTGFIALDGGSKLNLDTLWKTVKTSEIELAGNYNLVFAWRSDYSVGTMPPAGVDNIIITKINCPMPTGLEVDSITYQGATFTWDAAEDGGYAYAIALDTLPMPADEAFIALTDTFVKVSSLPYDNADYIFYLRHDCGSAKSGAAQLAFKTKQRPADPSNYSEDFEGNTEWNLINGALTNKWVIDTAAHNGAGSTKALYISNDGGATNAYTNNSATTVYAARLFYFEEGNYSFQYEWKANGESNYDLLRVALVPSSKQLTASSSMPSGMSSTSGTALATELPAGWIALDGGSKLNLSTAWNSYQSADLAIEAGEYNLVFLWRNDGSGGSQTPAAVDNIRISKINCLKPTGLAVDSITAVSAFFTWDTLADNSAWKYAYALASADEPADEAFVAVTDTFVSVKGLTQNTAYIFYLRQDCGESMSQSISLPFLTKQLPADLPFADDFEGGNQWALINGAITNAWVVDTAAHNGEGSTKALYISNDGGAHNAYTASSSTYAMVYATKSFNFEDGGYIFKYDWRAYGYSTSDYLRVALVPDSIELAASTSVLSGLSATALPTGWISLDNNQKLNLQNTWKTYTSSEMHVDAGIYKVVFAWRNSSSYGSNPPAAIDNFSITPVACARPSGLEITDRTAVSATLKWNNGTADQTAWQIAYAPAANYDLETATIVDAPTNPYVLQGLTEETSYYVQVRAKCGETDDEVSAWSAVASFTTVKACQTPDGIKASAIATDSAVISWNTYAQTGFNLRYKADSTNAEWIVENDVDTPFVLNGLEDAMVYLVQVQVACKAEDDIWSAAYSFKTECGAISVAAASYSENFDSYTATSSSASIPSNYPNDQMPECWKFLNRSTTSSTPQVFLSTNSSYIVSGNCLFFKSNRDYPLYAILPKFVESTYALQLNFSYRNESLTDANGTLIVGYMTDPTDEATFTAVKTCARTSSITPVEMFFEDAPANSYIAFKYQGSTTTTTTYYLSIDNVVVSLVPPCKKPTDLRVSNVTEHTAKLRWESNASAWQICVNDDLDNLIDVTDTAYVLPALSGETDYTVKVRANCGEQDGVSEWSNAVNFTTLISCPKPTALEAVLTPGNGSIATLTWKAGGSEATWVAQYSPNADFSDSVEVVVADSALNIELLTAETTYYARVKADCGETDGLSAWSAVISFTPTDAYVLPINNGNATNDKIPFYGLYADETTSSQFIIPAADLASLLGDTIKQLTFYSTSSYANVAWGVATFDVYMAEVTTTSLADFSPWSAMTKVVDAATLSVVNQEMEVRLSTPYHYLGGNLLIGFDLAQSGSYKGCTWVGKEAAAAAYYSYTAYGSVTEEVANFLPKMSIHYAKSETTGLIEAGAGRDGKAVKFIHNGHVYILVNGTVYDATGRLVETK